MSEFKRAISKGITAINMKTNNFVEQSKCKTYISTLEDEVKALKCKVGDVLYANWKAGSASVADVERYLTAIAEKENIMKEQMERMQEMQTQEQQILGTEGSENTGHIFCSMCGAQNSKDYKFCVKCGKEL